MRKIYAAHRIVFSLSLMALLLFIHSTAYAACTNPTRADGAIIYNTDQNVPQVCANGTWVALGALNPSAGGGSCSNPSRTEGAIIYNVDYGVLQYCDGTNWIAVQAAPAGGFGAAGCTPSVNNLQNYASNSSSSSYTLASYAVPNVSGRTLVVTGHNEDTGNDVIQSVTFDGTPLTEAIQLATSTGVYSGIWYLQNPAVTTGDIVVTFTGSVARAAISASTLDCTSQIIPPVVATTESDLSPANTSVTTWIADMIIMDAMTEDNAASPTVTQGPDQVILYSSSDIGGGASSWGTSYRIVPSAGSATVGWSVTGAADTAHSVAAFVPLMSGE